MGASVERRQGDVRRGDVVPTVRQLSAYVRRRGARAVGRELARELVANDLLTYASAVSFQTVFALIPSALAALALLGFLDLTEVWSRELAPHLRDRLSGPGFEVVQQTVTRILTQQRGFWLTLGAALALWEISGAVRATIGALNRVYAIEETRGVVKRAATSLALSVAVVAGLGSALVAIHLGPRFASLLGLPDGLRTVVSLGRWLVAIVLMLVVVGLVLRYAPASRQRAPWVGFVGVAVVAAWLAASSLFGLYATHVASYASVFGGLAFAIVLLTYVYLSATSFLAVAQVDAVLRRHAEEEDDRTRSARSDGE